MARCMSAIIWPPHIFTPSYSNYSFPLSFYHQYIFRHHLNLLISLSFSILFPSSPPSHSSFLLRLLLLILHLFILAVHLFLLFLFAFTVFLFLFSSLPPHFCFPPSLRFLLNVCFSIFLLPPTYLFSISTSSFLPSSAPIFPLFSSSFGSTISEYR